MSLSENLPVEIYIEIAKNLSLVDQTTLLFVNKFLNLCANRYIVKLSEKKLIIEELLITPIHVKVLLVFVKRFNLDKIQVMRTLLQRYKANKQIDLLVLAGIFCDENTFLRVFIREFHTLCIPSYAWLSSIDKVFIDNLNVFLGKIEIGGAHVDPCHSCFIYELKKILKNLRLIQNVSLSSGAVQALICRDNLSRLADYLKEKSIYNADQLINPLPKNENKLQELLNQNSLLWLFELFTNPIFSHIAFSNVGYDIFLDLQLQLNGNIVLKQNFYLSFEDLWNENFNAIGQYVELAKGTSRSCLLQKFLDNLQEVAFKNNNFILSDFLKELLNMFF